MFSNLSTIIEEPAINYPISDNNLPFPDYIARSRAIIEKERKDLKLSPHPELVIDSNSPFELYPANPIKSSSKLKYGVLMIHGLLDSPFSFRDIGATLQDNGILCRSILLPGHGTTPEHLFSISHQDWIKALEYGIESFRKEVDYIYLAGYSTGATLSIYRALQDANLAGIILLAPAIRIKAPVDLLMGWQYIKKQLRYPDKQWLYHVKEEDYTKYCSITINAVTQVATLTKIIKNLRRKHTITCPIFMISTHEDETICNQAALKFFSGLNHPDSKLLLYTSRKHAYKDKRIIARKSQYPKLNIQSFSHISLPFSPNNFHYGEQGDYPYASHYKDEFDYGAFNTIEIDTYNFFYKLKIAKKMRRSLTYNPDFNFMAEQITKFILHQS